MINNLCIDYSNDLNKSISNIQDSIRKINREDDNAMFITQNDIYFKKIEPFTYEPYGSDSVR